MPLPKQRPRRPQKDKDVDKPVPVGEKWLVGFDPQYAWKEQPGHYYLYLAEGTHPDAKRKAVKEAKSAAAAVTAGVQRLAWASDQRRAHHIRGAGSGDRITIRDPRTPVAQGAGLLTDNLDQALACGAYRQIRRRKSVPMGRSRACQR